VLDVAAGLTLKGLRELVHRASRRAMARAGHGKIPGMPINHPSTRYDGSPAILAGLKEAAAGTLSTPKQRAATAELLQRPQRAHFVAPDFLLFFATSVLGPGAFAGQDIRKVVWRASRAVARMYCIRIHAARIDTGRADRHVPRDGRERKPAGSGAGGDKEGRPPLGWSRRAWHPTASSPPP